mmetsp:Transcript_5900/g.14104  ORF Transcript_5900/g.14104 Transcript_5900/m.14104 type:complete len:239 (-) Transcript_5900:3858-4574(-)
MRLSFEGEGIRRRAGRFESQYLLFQSTHVGPIGLRGDALYARCLCAVRDSDHGAVAVFLERTSKGGVAGGPSHPLCCVPTTHISMPRRFFFGQRRRSGQPHGSSAQRAHGGILVRSGSVCRIAGRSAPCSACEGWPERPCQTAVVPQNVLRRFRFCFFVSLHKGGHRCCRGDEAGVRVTVGKNGTSPGVGVSSSPQPPLSSSCAIWGGGPWLLFQFPKKQTEASEHLPGKRTPYEREP